ncbi:MAG: hypothetical protein GX660_12245, partial [Clostridiaceae bacterium]|nr:hypothetical protein [Clostridiaceae bacterium]
MLFITYASSAYGQLVGSPGSKQSAVARCSPASYYVTYSFEVDGGIYPSGTCRILFKLVDQDNNQISFINYVGANVNIAPSTDPPFNWVISRAHLFNLPLDTDCEYIAQMYFYYDPAGGLDWQLIDLTQTQPLSNWHTDDDGDGYISVSPNIEEVCIGQPLIDFPFHDASQFACIDPNNLSNPNHENRYVQFIYGTSQNPSQSIPNLYINDGSSD